MGPAATAETGYTGLTRAVEKIVDGWYRYGVHSHPLSSWLAPESRPGARRSGKMGLSPLTGHRQDQPGDRVHSTSVVPLNGWDDPPVSRCPRYAVRSRLANAAAAAPGSGASVIARTT